MEKTRHSTQLTLVGLVLTMTAFSFACLRQDEPAATARLQEIPGQESSGQQDSALESRLVAVEGEVEYRRGDRGDWKRARPDVRLKPGDWVKTAGDGQAEIRFRDGSTYLLRPDTLIHLTPLLDGAPDTEAWIDVDLTGFGLHSDPPAGPRLVSPAGDKEIDLETQKVLRLAWEEVPDAPRYALHVSRSVNFDANVIEDADRRKPSARLGIQGEGTFYWRVAAYDAAGEHGAWSETRSFHIAHRG